MSIGYNHFIMIGVLLILNCISHVHLFKIEVNDIVQQVNSIPNNSWKAELNFNISFLKNPSSVMGVLPRNILKDNLTYLENEFDINRIPLPEKYDVQLKWSECASVVSIRDQSNCGSCWAIATASAFGDRLCMISNTEINKVLSGQYVTSCCKGKCGDGCNGGQPEEAWKYIKNKGLCTGGEYDSKVGCQPYGIAPCSKDDQFCKKKNVATPQCYENQCTNSYYENPLPLDLYRADKIYSVKPRMKSIMNDIYKNGPVVATMQVYEDFVYYKDGLIGPKVILKYCVPIVGIYQFTKGELQGEHAVKLMGWGQEDGIDYWLGANSWGTSWGMNGRFKIIRGKNECGIENRVSGGIPSV